VGDVAAFEEMKAELLKSGEARKLMAKLGKDLTINVKAGGPNNFNPNTNTINIDPSRGVRFSREGVVYGYAPPVEALAHEMAHAASYRENPYTWESRGTQMNVSGWNAEEEEAVEVENRIGAELGWTYRPGYIGGVGIATTSATSTEFTNEMLNEWMPKYGEAMELVSAMENWKSLAAMLPFEQETTWLLEEKIENAYWKKIGELTR